MFRMKWIRLGMVFCLLFLMGIMGAVHAETQGEISGLPWTLDDQGCLTVGGPGTLEEMAFSDHLEISSAVIDEGVTGIENFAFLRCKNMQSLSLPESLQTFGVNVITQCGQLQSIRVAESNPSFSSEDGILYDAKKQTLIAYPAAKTKATLPESLESIGMYALSSAAVEQLTLPKGLKEIGDGAFTHLTALQSVEIPAGVTDIGYSLFLESPQLKSVIFRNELEALPNSTFASCGKLEEVVLPKGIKKIGSNAFYACISLKSVEIPDTVERLDAYAFHYCIRLNYVELPDALKTIEERVFQNAYALKSISIPAGVTNIGNGAFFGCSALTDVYFEGTREQWAAISIEDNNSPLLDANIHYGKEMPDSAKVTEDQETITLSTIYGDMIWTNHSVKWNKGTIEWHFDKSSGTLTLSGTGEIPPMNPNNYEGWKIYNLETKKIVIGKGIEGIGFQAFGQFRMLETVSLPAGLCRIGYAAFSDCNALRNINLPASLTQFDDGVFSGCVNLTSIELQDGTEKLPEGLFQYCSRLKKVSLPQSVTAIDSYAFYLCENLTDIYYAGNEEDWAKITVADNNVWLLMARTHYGELLPVDISRYEVLWIPQETTCIDAEAFVGVDAELVVIPATCRQIESRAFADCEHLLYVILPPEASVQMAEDAFEGSNAVIRYQ